MVSKAFGFMFVNDYAMIYFTVVKLGKSEREHIFCGR